MLMSAAKSRLPALFGGGGGLALRAFALAGSFAAGLFVFIAVFAKLHGNTLEHPRGQLIQRLFQDLQNTKSAG